MPNVVIKDLYLAWVRDIYERTTEDPTPEAKALIVREYIGHVGSIGFSQGEAKNIVRGLFAVARFMRIGQHGEANGALFVLTKFRPEED